MEPTSLSVRQLNMYVKSLLEGDVNLSAVTLVGEISNFKNHYSSGHLYFVLKDSEASVRVVMFRANALRINFLPADGMMVALKGYVSLYERDGQFQFYAESMLPFGKGDLALEFERIKAKLEAEGLFAVERKRKLPVFPQKVGVITSETGAAISDILNVSARRFPLTQIVLFPALVQGISAPKSLIEALEKAYKRTDLDVLIIGRGGGSAEDLSYFNDEMLAITIAASPIPIVSAVGHEVDFSISDYVADFRAPTPSAAAEVVFPSKEEILNRISVLKQKCKSDTENLLLALNNRVEMVLSKPAFRYPDKLFAPFELRLDKALIRLESTYKLFINEKELLLGFLTSKFEALGPTKTFERGFSVAYKDGTIVKTTDDIKIGDSLNLKLAKGSLECTVQSILED